MGESLTMPPCAPMPHGPGVAFAGAAGGGGLLPRSGAIFSCPFSGPDVRRVRARLRLWDGRAAPGGRVGTQRPGGGFHITARCRSARLERGGLFANMGPALAALDAADHAVAHAEAGCQRPLRNPTAPAPDLPHLPLCELGLPMRLTVRPPYKGGALHVDLMSAGFHLAGPDPGMIEAKMIALKTVRD